MAQKQKKRGSNQAPWFLYMLRCSDDSLYTGITNNLEKRTQLHRSKKGAKYTRSRLPVSIVFKRKFSDHARAARLEVLIKGLEKTQKEALVVLGSKYIQANRRYFTRRAKSNRK